MANTIAAALYPNIYAAAFKAARKQVGFISSVTTDFDGAPLAQRAGEDKNYITVPVAGAGTYGAYTPAQVTTVGGNSTDTSIQVQITENNMVAFHLTADEKRSLDAGADNAKTLFEQKMAMAMETLCDYIEEDIAEDIKSWSSRARGTAGVTPFASDLSALTAAMRELDDNGAPSGDRFFIMDAAASEKFMNLAIVQQANVAASSEFLRQGTLLNHLGFGVKVSRKIAAHTKGTATLYDIVGAPAVGAVTLTVDGCDAGTMLAGDVVAFAVTDPANYVVRSCVGSGAAVTSIVINKPGLKVLGVATTEGVTGASYTPNIAMSRSGYILVVRPPAIDPTPILRTMVVRDSVSGLPFTICECLGDGLTTWRVHAAWGYTGVNGSSIVTIMG